MHKKILVMIAVSAISLRNLYAADLKLIEAKKAQSVLAIIDMQPEYLASHDNNLVAQIIFQINKAKSKDQKIIFVEYGPEDTIHQLLHEIREYKHNAVFVKKITNSGACEIKDVLENDEVYKIKICGVNTDACVQDTVQGLLVCMGNLEKITVLGDACATCNSEESHRNALMYMHYLDKVTTKGKFSCSLPDSLNALNVYLEKNPDRGDLRKIRAAHYKDKREYKIAFRDYLYLQKKCPADQEIVRSINRLRAHFIFQSKCLKFDDPNFTEICQLLEQFEQQMTHVSN